MDATEHLDRLFSPPPGPPTTPIEIETDRQALFESLMAKPRPDEAEMLARYRPSWMRSAACGDTDLALFFPERGRVDVSWRDVCANCDVRDECLGYALADTAIVGNWGGTTEAERNALRRRSRVA